MIERILVLSEENLKVCRNMKCFGSKCIEIATSRFINLWTFSRFQYIFDWSLIHKISVDWFRSWVTFKDQMEIMLSENDRKGIMVPRVRKINRKTSIYTYPLPECRCLQQSHNTTLQLTQPAR